MFVLSTTLYAQSDITAITVSNESATSSTDNVTSPSDASNSVSASAAYTLNYGSGNDVRVDSYTVGGLTYNNFVAPDTLLLRRVSSSRLVNIWYQDNGVTASVVTIQPTKVAEADAIYLSNALNTGYDNILVNDDDLASGSIEVETERVDVIWYSGIQTPDPDEAIFPIIERGGNDNIVVAPILTLDSNGDPATYGTAIGISENDWPGVGQTYTGYIILRRETVGVDPIPLLDIGSQTVQGVAISFTNLDIAADETIYGYSIFPADVVDGYTSGTALDTTPPEVTIDSGVDLADISTFPTTTKSSDSGLDLIAGVAAGVASTTNVIIENKGPGGYKAALSTWLKANEADDITTSTDGSTVTDWQDHWIGNHDATTGTAAPTYRSTSSTINFNPTVDFTASATSLTIANNTDFNTATSYTNKGLNFAFRTSTTDITDRQVIYEQGGNTRGIIVYIRSGNLHVSAYNRNSDGTGSPWNNSGNITTVSTAVALDTEYILTLELDGNSGTTGTLTPYLNGASFGTLSSVGLLFSDTDGIEFGGSDGSTQYDDGTNSSTNSFEGEISELIYCNEPGSFTTAQRDRIESYLAIKYGITLDQAIANDYVNSAGTVIFDATNDETAGGFKQYNNDIAGIGRDDDSELDQPKSRSENSDGIVIIDKGNTIGTDDSWLIWGNDNGALTETTALTMPDTIDARLTRVWRVAEEKEVQTTSVSFDLTGLGLSSNAADFSLLIAGSNAVTVSGNDADFSNATVVSGGTFNGNIITFTGIDLEDGQYFTLGTDFETCAPGGVEADLALWFEADSGTNTTTNGSDVTSWEDQSLNGTDAAEANGGGTPAEPTFVTSGTNFNPAISFTDQNSTNNSWLRTSTIPATADMSLIAVYSSTQADESGDNAAYDAPAFVSTDDSNPGANYSLGQSAGRVHAKIITGDQYGARTTGTFNDGNTHIALATRVQSTAAGSVQLYIDGNNEASAVSDVATLNLGTGVGIGNHYSPFDNNAQFAGNISEVIIFSDDLTSDERNRVETYLAVKYGITKNSADDGTTGSVDERDYRDSEGTVIWDFTDQSSGYNNDIAGIGRDDAQCFEQRQSSSINSDGLVTMGLGGIEATNAANSNSFTADNSFQVWGNDNDATAQASANTSDVPGIITERMERIWHVQETGTVGATTITFDISGLGYTGTSASDFNLITSSTSTMASGTITPAASFSSNTVTFTGVNFSDGDFFTLGTARSSCGPGGITTGLVTWLRGDEGITLSGSEVTTWADQNSSNNATGSVGNRPDIADGTVNFNDAVDFTSANSDYLSASGGGFYTNDYFVVFQPDNTITSASTNESVFTADRSGGDFDGGAADFAGLTLGSFTSAFADEILLHGMGGGADWRSAFTGAGSIPSGQPYIFNVKDNTSSSPTGTDIYQDGITINNSSAGSYLSGTNLPYVLGAYHDLNPAEDFFDGRIAEVITFSSRLDDANRRKVQSYLAIKYGVTLSQDGSLSADDKHYFDAAGDVIWNSTTNSTYNNDIAGIGRDDLSCFSQKQSSSVNSDDILTVGLGAVATDNAANINTFADDGDYLVWGNDDGATAEASKNTVDVPNSVSERMTRIWKVEDTGTVGETELQFDLTGLGYSVADPTAFTLLVGGTATMADATVITGGTLNGNVLSFTGVDLTDGQFFTIGTGITICGPGGVNTNIALWLKADVEVFSDAGTTAAVDGNDVQQWNDQGTANLNASEVALGGAGPIEPTFQTSEINFNPVVNFTDPGSTNNSYMRTGAASAGTVNGDFTLISVFKTGQTSGTANDNVNSPALLSTRSGSGLDNAIGMENGTIWVNADSDAAFEVETTSTYNNNLPHIAMGIRDVSTGDLSLYVDAAQDATATGITTSLTNADGGFGIGNHFTSDVDAQYAGDIAETIAFNQILTSDERNRVESYLALKYGITLAGADDGTTGSVDERDYRGGDGGTIWDYSGKTTYSNDIFGIGRDDLSCLDQTQSKSANSDAIVTINNTGGFSVDDSWLVSGNDNAALEATRNTERPATINSRLNREWQVQETGTVGTVELTFDLSSVTGTASGSNNLTQTRLMVDDDGDFSNGGTTLISPSATNGGSQTVTFQVNFTDGQYYTLGSIENDALPITLISFDVNNYKDDQVKLDWVTASEVNNAFYTIERSTDGVNFETVANLDGAGNSSDLLYYTFVDVNPLNGTSFYRLKQTDFGGEFDYSEIRSVKVERQFEANFSAYPNPIVQGESLTINYTVESDQVLSLTILSNTGQVIHRQEQQVYASQQSFQIQTDKMKKGLNLLRILDRDNNTKILKILVR
ncbi:T9SS type A sorting domain-containing protein [Roseivirga sp. 4D4]|uniref:T9SS type A sorting domain-containing protein n=1 Tax=Roseivirga sp. 4D4 TaxID=1889784 RepID=UPI001112CBBC|nr:T9SS type A sorting domain-containing protein [Roseivirga sp. 4D4]